MKKSLFTENQDTDYRLSRRSEHVGTEATANVSISDLINCDVEKLAHELSSINAYKTPVLNLKEATRSEPKTYIGQSTDFFGKRPRTREVTTIDFYIPFTGTSCLFNFTPSKRSSTFPFGEIRDNTLIIFIQYFSDQVNEFNIKSELDKQINLVNKFLNFIEEDVERHNRHLHVEIKKALMKRKSEASALTTQLDDFDIPVRVVNQKANCQNKRFVKFDSTFQNATITEPDGSVIEETFSPTQALALKYIKNAHENGVKKVKSKDILDSVPGYSTRMRDLFKRTKNKKSETHPLFNQIIKHDSRSFYWLELS